MNFISLNFSFFLLKPCLYLAEAIIVNLFYFFSVVLANFQIIILYNLFFTFLKKKKKIIFFYKNKNRPLGVVKNFSSSF